MNAQLSEQSQSEHIPVTSPQVKGEIMTHPWKPLMPSPIPHRPDLYTPDPLCLCLCFINRELVDLLL